MPIHTSLDSLANRHPRPLQVTRLRSSISTSDSKEKGVVIYSFQVLESLGQKCISVCTASSSVVSLLLPFVWMCCYTLMWLMLVVSKDSFAKLCLELDLGQILRFADPTVRHLVVSTAKHCEKYLRTAILCNLLPGTGKSYLLNLLLGHRPYCEVLLQVPWILRLQRDMLRVESRESRWHHSPKLKAVLVKRLYYNIPIHWSRIIYFGPGVVTRPSCMCLIYWWCCEVTSVFADKNI